MEIALNLVQRKNPVNLALEMDGLVRLSSSQNVMMVNMTPHLARPAQRNVVVLTQCMVITKCQGEVVVFQVCHNARRVLACVFAAMIALRDGPFLIMALWIVQSVMALDSNKSIVCTATMDRFIVKKNLCSEEECGIDNT